MTIQQAILAMGASITDIYAKWNPVNKGPDIGLSGGNRIISLSSPTFYYESILAQTSLTGNSYWEITATPIIGGRPGDSMSVGIVDVVDYVATGSSGRIDYLGGRLRSIGLWDDGSVVRNGAVVTTGPGYANPVTWKIAFNATSRGLWLGAVGYAYIGGGDPATGSSPTVTMATGTYYPAACCGVNGQVISANFGQSPFAGTVPSGFKYGVY